MKKAKPSILPYFGIAPLIILAGVHASTLEGLPGTLFSPSAQPLGHLGLSVSVGAFGHQDASMIRLNRFLFKETGKVGDPDTAQIQDLQSGTLRLNVALGLGRFFDVGLTAPYHADFIGDTKAKDLSGAGIGDPTISAKAALSLVGDRVLTSAFLGSLTIPSKSPNGFLPKQAGYIPADSLPGAPRFFSSYGMGGSIQSLWTLDLTRLETPIPIRTGFNIGASHTGAQGSAPRALIGAGFQWLPLPSLGFFGDLQTETRFSRVSKPEVIGKEYSYAAFGFSAAGEDGIFFAVALQKSLPQRPFHVYSKSLVDGLMTYDTRYQPRLAVAFNIGWSGALVSVDSDHDMIPDNEDLCPNEAEDLDNFQDADGCPERDNDGDSVYDLVDKCPLQPEDQDGFQDDDGCPDLDNDRDGLPDLQDKCPTEAEDMDGFEDYDGCPELDNDKDGVQDTDDKCQGLAEDMDGFEDGDGCPEPDNDQDRIPDVNDKCPMEAETFNGFEDGDGCPDMAHGASGGVIQSLEKRVLLSKVRFKGNTSELMPESYPSLIAVSDQIKATPGVLVEVRGYVDEGTSELAGMRLSEARAVAVRNYLITRGIADSQVLARGMGARDPIASNKTPAGRVQNRRIEIHRLD